MTTRTIRYHIVPGDEASNQIEIKLRNKPGEEGEPSSYDIFCSPSAEDPLTLLTVIGFQRGTVADEGVNGVTVEALLAIVMDRLEYFQSGPLQNNPTGVALSHCHKALESLKRRTADRIKRGVEGTYQK